MIIVLLVLLRPYVCLFERMRTAVGPTARKIDLDQRGQSGLRPKADLPKPRS